MKEHTIEVTLKFTSWNMPDEPEWSDWQWRREIVDLLEDEHRGLAQYKGCQVLYILIDGVSSEGTKEG